MFVDRMAHSECSCLSRKGVHCRKHSLSKFLTGRYVVRKKGCKLWGGKSKRDFVQDPKHGHVPPRRHLRQAKVQNSRKKRRCTRSTNSSTLGDAWIYPEWSFQRKKALVLCRGA